ncbi:MULTISPECIES: ABC transporter permease [Rhizobium/Agrobacterium group]|uniref:ABC transporter permease n=2 Tax=Neorhizobium TaxID=1525371 RepID=A0ABV0M369_9HYPH|nr:MULTISPECIES: ABC transporter permease [Rhizobium/Agrobacterium group]KGD89181.1 peptide ABC transporter permease [Rhizobium sp. YS-1r]MCC2609427.1 ABC transporter permease [Neorhizobium petrolearium]WGI69638.1 ABC transporter permease [Neorhizobium petrolearium]
MSAFLKRYLTSHLAAFGLAVLLVALFAALFGPWFVPYDPSAQDILQRLKPPLWQGSEGIHLFGTDALGRDIFSRIVVGARVSMLVGVSSVVISGAVGVTFGLIAGYEDKYAGRVLMMLTDIQLAIPFLVLALAVAAVVGPSLWNIIAILGLTNWVQYARVVRAECLVLREREFIQAAYMMGISSPHILTRHLLPNVMSSVIVISSLLVAKMILFESSLSFLGLGVPPETPTWGTMISEGRNYIGNAWWVATIPGFAIFFTVVGTNLVGDRLRDLLDPRLRQMEG